MKHWIRVSAFVGALALPMAAQDRLKTMQGYEAAQRVAREVPDASRSRVP